VQPPHGPADQEFIDPVVLSLLQHAEDIGALAIIVFGSVARGEADYQSDFDLLVVVEDFSARLRTIDRVTKQGGVGTSPLVLTRATLSNGLSTRSSFIAHLLDEGLLIFETAAWQELKLALQTIAADADLLAAEVRRRVKELEPLSHAERFSNSPVTAKSHVYGIARALVIARLLQLGIHEYSWRRAFDCYAEIYPEQRREIETLKALRPYYEVARGRFGAVLPRDAERYDDLSGLVASVQRLAA
jgi:hypothetical protein